MGSRSRRSYLGLDLIKVRLHLILGLGIIESIDGTLITLKTKLEVTHSLRHLFLLPVVIVRVHAYEVLVLCLKSRTVWEFIIF